MADDDAQESTALAMAAPDEQETDAATNPVRSASKLKWSQKTPGEKFYDILQFSIGKVTIMVFTAVIAYVARYAKPNWNTPEPLKKMHIFEKGIPNPIHAFQDWLEKLLLGPDKQGRSKHELVNRAAGAAANTMVLFHGGNLFAPFMRWLENNRKNIAHFYNKRWGKPEDVEEADKRLGNLPHQTWGDVIKGRIAAWLIVFGSILTLDATMNYTIGKTKNPVDKTKSEVPRLDNYEEWFGRWAAKFTKKGKEAAAIANPQEQKEAYGKIKTYMFSKILAIDFYATFIGLAIWNFITRSSAKRRHEAEEVYGQTAPIVPIEDNETAPSSPPERKQHAAGMEQRSAASYAERVGKQPAEDHRTAYAEAKSVPQTAAGI